MYTIKQLTKEIVFIGSYKNGKKEKKKKRSLLTQSIIIKDEISECAICFEKKEKSGIKYVNCFTGYLCDENTGIHKENNKGVCEECRSKLKPLCPWCRSHDPLQLKPFVPKIRMRKCKLPFRIALKIRIENLQTELDKEVDVIHKFSGVNTRGWRRFTNEIEKKLLSTNKFKAITKFKIKQLSHEKKKRLMYGKKNKTRRRR